jgi:hypothetical protein
MISTPGHRASRRRQREALPAWSFYGLLLGTVSSCSIAVYCLLPRHGSLWSRRLLIASASWSVEGIFDGLACVKPHCLAGRNFNILPRLWIPPEARSPFRHIESAEAGDSYWLSGHEGLEAALPSSGHGGSRLLASIIAGLEGMT